MDGVLAGEPEHRVTRDDLAEVEAGDRLLAVGELDLDPALVVNLVLGVALLALGDHVAELELGQLVDQGVGGVLVGGEVDRLGDLPLLVVDAG